MHQPAVSQKRPQSLASLDEHSLQLWSAQSVISAFEDFLPPPTALREEVDGFSE
jgi:hypothetical protein